MKKCIYFTCLFGLLSLSHTLFAQRKAIRMRSTTEGFNVGLQAHTLGWSSDHFQYLDKNASSGYGGALRVGYGFSQTIEPYFEYAYTSMDISNLDAKAFSFSHLEGGLAFHFGSSTKPFRPFVEAGYSKVKASVPNVIAGSSRADLEMSGNVITFGGGFRYHLSLPVALTLKATGNTGNFKEIFYGGTLLNEKGDFATFRIALGLRLYISEL